MSQQAKGKYLHEEQQIEMGKKGGKLKRLSRRCSCQMSVDKQAGRTKKKEKENERYAEKKGTGKG